jgi:transposase
LLSNWSCSLGEGKEVMYFIIQPEVDTQTPRDQILENIHSKCHHLPNSSSLSRRRPTAKCQTSLNDKMVTTVSSPFSSCRYRSRYGCMSMICDMCISAALIRILALIVYLAWCGCPWGCCAAQMGSTYPLNHLRAETRQGTWVNWQVVYREASHLPSRAWTLGLWWFVIYSL